MSDNLRFTSNEFIHKGTVFHTDITDNQPGIEINDVIKSLLPQKPEPKIITEIKEDIHKLSTETTQMVDTIIPKKHKWKFWN